ncbi:pyridoxal phosphate-dependent aminotransferase [Vallicoccus soli]|uniref:pyridoxal phosphate-dependent aminotransferase n=1 Tax=Vallicoccus soli TaxID=2339232 RepID=UPI001C49977A|nr:pyridoxal phosphate-dependent aminotransferase [Vallicoccus soli]
MLTERMRGFGTTVFAEMSALAVRTGAINLGQGFPDTDGPASLLEDAVAAIRAGANQYPPGPGVPELRRAVAAHQQRFYGLDVDPDDVLVTAGATEAVAAALLALCERGDEVVVLEPYYDAYAAGIALAGAERRTVPLRFPGFALDLDALRAAVTPRTRVLVVNSPHNPTGTVLTRAELEAVAALARERDLLVLTDEVYEHLVFSGSEHVPLATLPGMAERTLTVSSAGKTFSVTGWKVGWVHGPRELVAAVRTVKQFLTYVGAAPFQPAVARALGRPDEDYAREAADLEQRRDLLVAGLRAAGFATSVPQGTYFVVADAAPLGFEDGYELCRRLPELAGVVAVPLAPFHDDPALGRSLVRFCFCKRREVLEDAATRLARLGG